MVVKRSTSTMEPLTLTKNSVYRLSPAWPMAGRHSRLGLAGRKKLENADFTDIEYKSQNSQNPKFKTGESFSFSKCPRFKDRPNYQSPSPGQYSGDINRESSLPQWSMGSSKRFPTNKMVDGPAPGSYDIRSPSSSKGAVIIPRRDNNSSRGTRTPGPSHYDVNRPDRANSPGWSFSKSNRRNNDRSHSTTPGPGQYSMPSLQGPKPTICCSRPREFFDLKSMLNNLKFFSFC